MANKLMKDLFLETAKSIAPKSDKNHVEVYKDVMNEAVALIKSNTKDGVTMINESKLAPKDSKVGKYIEILSEGLNAEDKASFNTLAKSVILESAKRLGMQTLNEAGLYSVMGYEALVLPIFRLFWPKSVAKDIVNFLPMKTPTAVYYFLNAVAQVYNSATGGYTTVQLPNYNSISTAGIILTNNVSFTNSQASANVLTTVNMTSTQTSVDQVFKITQITWSDSTVQNVSIAFDVNGNIMSNTSLVNPNNSSMTTQLSGSINFETGALYLYTPGSTAITSAKYAGYTSQENNLENSQITIQGQKTDLATTKMTYTATFPIELIQDAKALFDIDIQSELVSIMAQQIALEIDNLVITDLKNAALYQNPGNVGTFGTIPPAGFSFGPKYWLSQLSLVYNNVANNIFLSTFIMRGNILLVNPQDAFIIQATEGIGADGKIVGNDQDSNIGSSKFDISNGMYKVISHPSVPKGTIIVVAKPEELIQATYIFGSYQPVGFEYDSNGLTQIPYPINVGKPAFSLFGRYVRQIIRPLGVALITLDYTGSEVIVNGANIA